MHQQEWFRLVHPVRCMAQFAKPSKNPLNEVLVRLDDDAPHHQDSEPRLESPVPTRRSNKESSYQGSDVTSYWTKSTRIDGPNRKRKPCAKKDYAWFLSDDFDIAPTVEETGASERKRRWTLARWALLVFLSGALVTTLSVDWLKMAEAWDVAVWKWVVPLLVAVCGRMVAGWGVGACVLVVESFFHLKIGVLYVVYGTRRSIQNVVWLGLVTAAWHFIAAEGGDGSRVPRVVRKIMLCFLVSVSMWLAKTVFVKLLDSSFHLRSFFKRIVVSLYKQYVIVKLGGGGCEKVEWTDPPVKKKTLALKVRRMIEIVQAGDLPRLSAAGDEDVPVRSDEDDEDESSTRTREESVKDFAGKIFRRVASQSKCISQEELKRYVGEEKHAKALDLLRGPQGKDSFTDWMVEAYRERRTLALSLNDTKTAVDDLHHMMDAVMAVMILVVWLIVCGAPVTKFLIFITTQLAVAVYVFGNTGKTVVESIIFLFIMHPYDVGDRCEVDGNQLVVDEMTILSTVFLRCDSQKIIYPNGVLATKPIGNFSRSPAMSDAIEFSVHISTPPEKISDMKDDINKYINLRTDYWYSHPMILVKSVDDMNRLNMVVWPKHVVNHHDMARRWIRRSELIEEMIRVFKKHKIEYRMLPVDINVRQIGSGAVSDRSPTIWETCTGMHF